jgi:hypothetical protein
MMVYEVPFINIATRVLFTTGDVKFIEDVLDQDSQQPLEYSHTMGGLGGSGLLIAGPHPWTQPELLGDGDVPSYSYGEGQLPAVLYSVHGNAAGGPC